MTNYSNKNIYLNQKDIYKNQIEYQNQINMQKKRSENKNIVPMVIGVIAVFILLIGGVVLLSNKNNDNKNDKNNKKQKNKTKEEKFQDADKEFVKTFEEFLLTKRKTL